jgi:DNA-binding Xre family transcriptional regulator
MMKWTVRQVAEAKGFKNARELADKINTSYSSIYPIWDGSAKRADLGTLNKLCNLLDVPIGMLLVHLPDNSIEPVSETRIQSTRRSSSGSAKSKRESKQARAAVAIG